MATTLNKPAGLPVFPPHADAEGDCLLKRWLQQQPDRLAIDWPEGFAGGIAHRLDTSTSGAVVAADALDELAMLRTWFTAHRLSKRYLLLAARDVPWDRHVSDAPIAHHPDKRDRMVVQRGRNTPHRGKWYPARTRFRRIDGLLFEAIITGGVMHQIRVHAAFLGMPILGDRRYGGGPTPVNAPPGLDFYLHHQGMTGPEGWSTTPVPDPDWARPRHP